LPSHICCIPLLPLARIASTPAACANAHTMHATSFALPLKKRRPLPRALHPNCSAHLWVACCVAEPSGTRDLMQSSGYVGEDMTC
jgi:hypothetical protein